MPDASNCMPVPATGSDCLQYDDGLMQAYCGDSSGRIGETRGVLVFSGRPANQIGLF